MKSLNLCVLCVVTIFALAFSQTVRAETILVQDMLSSFNGSNTVHEGFEEGPTVLTGGALLNATEDQNDESNPPYSMILPCKSGPYTLSQSGMTLSINGVSSNIMGSGLPEVMIFSAEEDFPLGKNGNISQASQLPDGDHLLLGYNHTTSTTIKLTFPTPVSKFGGYFTEYVDNTGINNQAVNYLLITAYGTDGHTIASTLAPAVNMSTFKDDSSFYGFQASDGEKFGSVTITPWTNNGAILGVSSPAMDGLMFVPAASAVPEPGTFVLLAAAATSLFTLRFRCRRKKAFA
jgi:hypothetical protein